MQGNPAKFLANVAFAVVLCAGFGSAQLLPNQAVTVDTAADRLFIIDDSGAILSSALLSSTSRSTGIDAVVTPDGHTALVTLFDPARVDFFDLTTSPPTRTGTLSVPFAAEDIDIGCTSSGFALVTDGGGSGLVLSVNVTTRTIANTLTLPVGVTAQAVDVTHDGTLALVAGSNTNTVRVLLVNPTTGVLTDTGVNVPRGLSLEPNNVTISPTRRTALVANRRSNAVDVLSISGSTVTYVTSIDLGAPQHSIAFTPDGRAAYVYQQTIGVVAKFAIDALDNVTDTGVRVSGVGSAPAFFGVEHVAVTSTGKLYVRATTAFRVISTATDTVTAGPTSIVGAGGGGIATLCHSTSQPPSTNQPPICVEDFAQARSDFLEPSPESFVVTEGHKITVPITVGDPDGGVLTAALSGPAGATLVPPTSGTAPFTTDFVWTPTAADKAAAPHAITITVTDSAAAPATCSFTVEDINLNPACDAGGDQNGEQRVQCTSTTGAVVQLNGTATDPDDPASSLSYHWDISDLSVVLNDADIANPIGTFPHGVTMATLTVTDGRGGFSTCDVNVVVQDTVPPDVECTTDKAVLWPPDHTMHTIQLIVQATDTCTDPSAIVPLLVILRSDEPDDANGVGDGNTTGDVNGADGFSSPVDVTTSLDFDTSAQVWVATVQLRAEREGTSDGRKYTIDVVAQDTHGNLGTSSCCVVVPHDRRR